MFSLLPNFPLLKVFKFRCEKMCSFVFLKHTNKDIDKEHYVLKGLNKVSQEVFYLGIIMLDCFLHSASEKYRL